MSTGYHHGNLRASLVEAAVELARTDGPDGLALRRVARQVGVSHNAAYRHFADRDQLVAEVGAYALGGLCLAMERRLEQVDEPEPVTRARLRLSGLGRGYVDFALSEPGIFSMLFTAYVDLADRAGRELPDPLAMLGAALDELVDVGYLDPARREGGEVTCWSAVHGFASLYVQGPMRDTPEADRDAALSDLLDTIDRGYGSGAD